MKVTDILTKLGYGGPSQRLNHSRMYMCTIVGLFFMSMSLLIIGPIPGSVLGELDGWTQQTLTACVLLGSFICIAGFLTGTRVFRPKADIRIAYQIGKYGLISIAFAMGFYAVAVIIHVNGLFWGSTLSSALGFAILGGCVWISIDFEYETEKLDQKFNAEIKRIVDDDT